MGHAWQILLTAVASRSAVGGLRHYDCCGEGAAPTCAWAVEAYVRTIHRAEGGVSRWSPPVDRPRGRLLRPLARPLPLTGGRPVGERGWQLLCDRQRSRRGGQAGEGAH